MYLAIFLLALFIGLLAIFIISGDTSDIQLASTAGIIIFAVIIAILIVAIDSKRRTEPKAIDVYRNKTTLQITYQDSIPVDTVVVFK